MTKHDAFVRHVLSDLNTAAAFMKAFLMPMAEKLDLTQLELRPDSFVGEKLDKTATDLLFHVPWRDRNDAFVALLVEHKSEGAARASGEHLPLQLRGQEIDLLRQHRRNHPSAPIPLVLLVAIYHGAKRYKGPRTVGESMGLPDDLIPLRWKHQDIYLVDLALIEDTELPQDKLGLFLHVLKHIYDENFLDVYQSLVPALQALDSNLGDRSFVIALNKYLATSANMENLAKFCEIAVKSYSEETGGATMTLYEVAVKKGERQNQEKIVRNMLEEGFDYQTIARVTSLTLEEIAIMAKRAS